MGCTSGPVQSGTCRCSDVTSNPDFPTDVRQCLRAGGGLLAMTDDVVRVPFEWDARKRAPSTHRTRNAEIGSPTGARLPHPAVFPPCAARRYRPPSALAAFNQRSM